MNKTDSNNELVKVAKVMLIKVHAETMAYFLSKLTQKKSYIAKRVFETEWQLEDWCKEDTYIEKWKLEILAQLSRKYNWVFFLLEPDNLPNKRKAKS